LNTSSTDAITFSSSSVSKKNTQISYDKAIYYQDNQMKETFKSYLLPRQSDERNIQKLSITKTVLVIDSFWMFLSSDCLGNRLI
jgi:hypothetical protein